MGVNEHENLSNFTIRHKIRFRNNIFITYETDADLGDWPPMPIEQEDHQRIKVRRKQMDP